MGSRQCALETEALAEAEAAEMAKALKAQLQAGTAPGSLAFFPSFPFLGGKRIPCFCFLAVFFFWPGLFCFELAPRFQRMPKGSLNTLGGFE